MLMTGSSNKVWKTGSPAPRVSERPQGIWSVAGARTREAWAIFSSWRWCPNSWNNPAGSSGKVYFILKEFSFWKWNYSFKQKEVEIALDPINSWYISNEALVRSGGSFWDLSSTCWWRSFSRSFRPSSPETRGIRSAAAVASDRNG